MAKFYCPFHSTNLTCSPNNHTIFNPNGGSWSSYYSWKVDIKGLEFSDTQFDANGKLKATTMIIDNTSHYIEWSYYEPYWAYENNWKIYIDTSNRIRFKYWFWDAGKGRWYWSTMWDPVDWAWDYDSNRPHYQSNFDGTVLGLTIEKGGKYDFYITRPANNQFKAVLRNVNTGVVQEYSWGGCAWNNNYNDGNGYELHIGETGMSFESAIISGYPYDSNCLHTITINGNTWDGKSSTIKIPIKSDCGYSSTINYDSPFIKKLSIVLPDSIGNVATASTAGTIKWSGGTYNASTKTWTKYFTYDQPYDFPTIADYINKTTIEGSNNFTDNKATMFIGYSTTQGGSPEYDDFGLFRTSTDLTLYPCIVLFGESATVTGLTSYDGPATVDGTTFYSTITPMTANSSLKSSAGNGIKIWSKHSTDGSTIYPAPANVVNNTNLVIASTVAGTKYNLKSGANARSEAMVSSVYAYPPIGGTIPATYDSMAKKCYNKIGKSSVKITTILLPVPSPNVQLVYNGNNQTQTFAGYDPQYMTVQYITNKDAGTYTAIFTLKDTVLTHWGDDSIDQKLVTWTIQKKPLTPTWGTRTWTFDDIDHSTTVTLSGIVSGDVCDPILLNNLIHNPGTIMVTATGVSNPNYTYAAGSVLTNTLTINKRILVLTWSDGEKPYDGTVIRPNLVVSNDVPTKKAVVTWNSSSGKDVAYYQSVAVLDPASEIYYELPDNIIYNLYISPVPVHIVWSPTSKDYDGTALTSIPTIINLAAGDVCNMTIIDNTIGPAVSAQIAQVTNLSNTNYTLEGSIGKDQLILIKDKLDPEHGKVYEYDPAKAGEGTAPNNHWIRVL